MVGPLIDGKYQIIRPLGQGRMGEVYEARNIGTGRHVAIKVIHGSYAARGGDHVARFELEARAVGCVDTPHIVEVLDIGRDRNTGSPFMVMELLVGEDLQALFGRTGPLPVATVLRILAQVCMGLEKAHAATIIHRDIKPANIFLADADDGQVIVKLLDFGIAKMKEEHGAGDNVLTQTGRLLGSPRYMSPEQVNGAKDIDARSDIWSVGVVAYELLTKHTPHRHPEMLGQLLMAICTDRVDSIQALAPWVPPDVARIVHRALSIEPAGRFATTTMMLDAIRLLLPREGIRLSKEMLVPISPEESRRKARTFSLNDRGPARWRLASRRSIAFGLAAVMTGVVALRLSSRWGLQSSRQLTAAVEALTVVPIQPVAPPPAGTVPPPSSAILTAQIAVVPAEVKVEIDGMLATVRDGVAEIRGLVGSVHHVRLSLANWSRESNVTLTETGPAPSQLELRVPHRPVTNAAAPRKPIAPPEPVSSSSASPPAPAPPASAPSDIFPDYK
jgi:serine/threonine protein kinase